MLNTLYIKNYALIDEIEIGFSRGLTILSGETGAGKSIIVGALGLLMGEKARISEVRSGEELCIVEGRLTPPEGHTVYGLLKARGIPVDQNEGIIVRRIVSRKDGGSKSFINSIQVTMKDLHDVMSALVDIHGQHEHQSLLVVKNHLGLLDRYGKLSEELEDFKDAFRRMEEIRKQIEDTRMDESEKLRRIDLLRYSINEIESASLEEGEDTALEDEYEVLKNYEKIFEAISKAYHYLKEGENSSVDLLDKAVLELGLVSEYSDVIKRALSELENAKLIIDEISYELKNYIESIEYEPGKIDRILGRLEQIKLLKKKYGKTIADIKNYLEKCKKELEEMELSDEILEKLQREYGEVVKEVCKKAAQLSARRRVASRMLEDRISEELKYIGMPKARFKVDIRYRETEEGLCEIDGRKYEVGPDGLDRVEFLFSANEGEPLLPLRNIASGGELSRVMLAVKSVLGEIDPITTFIFDEIDAGIGGRVSWAVGKRLKELSKIKQVICITHQAQIASRGELNIKVEKITRDGRSITRVKVLDEKEKTEEIARMISGEKITEAAKAQADQMIREAEKI
ncbi:MAG: DNA repair protein RecN [Spirochaetes bacterium]|nr:MAG: DNA repair protein RecN [Spirochaetota bacterium]